MSLTAAQRPVLRSLLLNKCNVTFETPSQRVSVFFDECNRQVISLTSLPNSKTKVVFQATDGSSTAQVLLPIAKRILSIKLNPARSVLAYHLEKSNIEFINIRPSSPVPSVAGPATVDLVLDDKRYVQSSRARNGKLIGFLWTDSSDLVMVTDTSVEFFSVDSAHRRLRFMRSFQSSTNWFVYQPLASGAQNPFSMLMVSTGSVGNAMQPYLFTKGQVTKLQRFDVEGDWQGREKLELFERSITIASIYGHIRLLVLQHESLNTKSRGAQILVYTVDHTSGVTSKTHTLDLDVCGRFAINVLDDLIIAHDQPSKKSFIFDIMISTTEKSDCPNHYVSLIDGQSIAPAPGSSEGVELYSLNWVFFQPNYIIDARKGCLWTLEIDLTTMHRTIQDCSMLLHFLSFRSNSEQTMLNRSKKIVARALQSIDSQSQSFIYSLAEVSAAFETLCEVIEPADKSERKPCIQTRAPLESTLECDTHHMFENYPPKISLSQEDFDREVFQQINSAVEKVQSSFSQTTSPQATSQKDHYAAYLYYVTAVLFEFIYVLKKREKSIAFCVYERLIRLMVEGGSFYQLVQMIRYEIITDSKQLVCLLLSLKDRYKPATEMGIDMLYRLDCLTDLIESINLAPDSLSERQPLASGSGFDVGSL